MQQPKIKLTTTGTAISYIIKLIDKMLETPLNEDDKITPIWLIMLLKFKTKYQGKYDENSSQKIAITLKLEIALAVLDLLEDGASQNPHVVIHLSECYNTLKKEYAAIIAAINKKPQALTQG